MDVKPVKTTKLYEGVIDYIIEMINSGVIRPGQQLPTENEFIDMLKVSKGVLREAFRVLEYRGIIETRPGEGRYMRSIIGELGRDIDYYQKYRRASLLDICECRQMIEVGLVRLAVRRATPKDIDELGEINQRMRDMVLDDKETDLDMEFHLAISRAAHNIVLLESMQNIINTLKNINEKSALTYQAWRTLCFEHQDIFEAVASRDENRAVYAMRTHLMNLRNAIMESREGMI
ncbi:MAG: FadR/GntR family transcriptional regulator [Thermoanaerobacteraceae bacterium]|nr:FadR/GntR family transcriptional regulator [Thermoanaerobacteraceae bacterium]